MVRRLAHRRRRNRVRFALRHGMFERGMLAERIYRSVQPDIRLDCVFGLGFLSSNPKWEVVDRPKEYCDANRLKRTSRARGVV